MRCKYCGRQAYITPKCPYCKEHYCLEHFEPKTHDCPSYRRPRASSSTPELLPTKAFKPQLEPKEIKEGPATQRAILDNAKKKLFAVSFVLVITEEILRLVSYSKNPPFLAYLDGNVFVKALNQFITPFYASLVVFALVCLTLFATTKLTSENQHMSSLNTNLFKRAIPICIFTVTSIIYITSITNWLFILAS